VESDDQRELRSSTSIVISVGVALFLVLEQLNRRVSRDNCAWDFMYMLRVLVRRFELALVAAILLSGGCSGGGSAGGAPPTSPSSPATVSSVAVSGAAPLVGTTAPFVATATLSNGTSMVVTTQAAWSSSNTAAATVDGAGNVTGIGSGESEIGATYQQVSGRLRIAVARGPCGTEPPGASNQAFPIFAAPFQGRFRLTNHFDHELPILGRDSNNYLLTPCGEKVPGAQGHAGVDYLVPTGTPIYAVADGEVRFAGLEAPIACAALGGQIVRDAAIEIRHSPVNGEQFGSRYVHLSRIDVTFPQVVTMGQQIGLSGDVGCSTAPHLHFAAWRFTRTNRGVQTQIDPYGWEGSGPDPWAAHPEGAASVWLWLAGRAPLISP
jgi:murein DD-endopeptidase MepM/ murein hydrolase activator NlpD